MNQPDSPARFTSMRRLRLRERSCSWLCPLLVAGYLAVGCSDSSDEPALRRGAALKVSQSQRDDAETEKEYPEAAKAYEAADYGKTFWLLHNARGREDDALNGASYIQTALEKIKPVFAISDMPQGTALSSSWQEDRWAARIMKSPEWPTIRKLLDRAAEQKNFDEHAPEAQTVDADDFDAHYPFLVKLLRIQALNDAKAHDGKSAAKCLNTAWNLSLLLRYTPHFAVDKVAEESRALVCDQVEKCIAELCPKKDAPNVVQALTPGFSSPGMVTETTQGPDGRITVTRRYVQQPTNQGRPQLAVMAPAPKPIACPQLEAFRSTLELPCPSPKMRLAGIEMGYLSVLNVRRPVEYKGSDPIAPSALTSTKAKATRMMEFWADNRKTLDRFDSDFVNAAADLKKSLEHTNPKASVLSGVSPDDLGHVFDLADAIHRNDQRSAAELALADSVIGWCKNGKWPDSMGQLPPPDRAVPGASELQLGGTFNGFQISLPVGPGASNANAQPMVQSRVYSTRLNQQVQTNLLASFPPSPTSEDMQREADESQWEQRPRNDRSDASAKLEADLAAYREKGLPALDTYEGADLSPQYLNLLQNIERQFSQDAHTRFTSEKSSVDPTPWLASFKSSLSTSSSVAQTDSQSPGKIFGEVLTGSVSDTSTVHFCAINLAAAYGAKAIAEAKQGNGAGAAGTLQLAWNILDDLKSEPVEVGSTGALFVGEEVCQDIEICAASLLSNPAQFEAFRTSLKCDGDPISVKRWISARIPMVIESAQKAQPSNGGPAGRLDASGFRADPEAKAAMARALEFWTENASVLDRLDTPDQSPIRKLNKEIEHLQQEHRTSFNTVKASVQTMLFGEELGFVAAYYLRDGEKILLDSMEYKIHHGAWPSSIEAIHSKTAEASGGSWKVFVAPAVTTSRSSVPQERFEVCSMPTQEMSMSSPPIVMQRNMLILNGPIVATYPPISSVP